MYYLSKLFKQYCWKNYTPYLSNIVLPKNNMLCEVKTMKHITENKHLLHRRAIAPTEETGKISWHVVPMQEMSCKTSSLSFFAKAGIRENQSTGQVGTRLSATNCQQSLSRNCQSCVVSTSVLGSLGNGASIIFISVHPSQCWID